MTWVSAVITAFTIQTDNHNLVFQDSGGLQQAQLNIFGKITHVSGRRAGVFEDPVITRATPQELAEAKERKSAYQKAVVLSPGRYRVDVIVRDITSGATGVRHVGFEVPKYDPAKLTIKTGDMHYVHVSFTRELDGEKITSYIRSLLWSLNIRNALVTVHSGKQVAHFDYEL